LSHANRFSFVEAIDHLQALEKKWWTRYEWPAS